MAMAGKSPFSKGDIHRSLNWLDFPASHFFGFSGVLTNPYEFSRKMATKKQTCQTTNPTFFTPPGSSAPQSSYYLPQVLEELHHRSAG